MSGSLTSLKNCLLICSEFENDHDYICECRPVDVAYALKEISRLDEQVLLVKKENARFRSALESIVARDPSQPGPKAAVVVSTSTMVAIAKQALEVK